MNTVCSVAALSLALLSASAAQAQSTISRPYIVAVSGRSLEVGKYASINPDCTSLGPTDISLIVAPQAGEVQVGEGRRYVAYAPGNPRAACNRRKIQVTFVTYRSRPGFTGQDGFAIEIVAPDGTAHRSRFSINVR